MTPEEERQFYLDSLLDLEDEYEKGDISERDYRQLKASYTKKASQAIRKLDDEDRRAQARREGKKERPRYFRVVAILSVVALLMGSLAAGLVLALNSGQRGSDDEAAGDVRVSTENLLSQANQQLSSGLQPRDDVALESAIATFNQVIEENPASVPALRGKAVALFALERTDESRTFFLQALAQDPQNIETLTRLALLEITEMNHDQAQMHLDQIDNITPPPSVQQLQTFMVNETQNFLYLRRLLDRYGDGKLADHPNPPAQFSDLQIPDAETALILVQAMVSQNIQAAEREYEVAALVLDLLVEAEPENVTALITHGLLLTNNGIFPADSDENARGFTSFERAVEVAPESLPGNDPALDKTEVRIEIARVHLLNNDNDQALEEIARAVELAPDSYGAKVFQGRVLAISGRSADAVEAFTQALELEPDSEVEARYFRLAAYYCTMQYEESIADANVALEEITSDIALLQVQAQQGLNNTNALRSAQQAQDEVSGWRTTITEVMETGMPDADLTRIFSCLVAEENEQAEAEGGQSDEQSNGQSDEQSQGGEQTQGDGTAADEPVPTETTSGEDAS